MAGRCAAGDRAALHRAAPHDGRAFTGSHDRDTAPLEVVIYVPTQGASIGYTTEEGAAQSGASTPARFASIAPMTLRAKAIRYGYKESAETRVEIRTQ